MPDTFASARPSVKLFSLRSGAVLHQGKISCRTSITTIMNDNNIAPGDKTFTSPLHSHGAKPVAREMHLNGVPSDEVLAELRRIVSSDDFPGSHRNKRVLEYVVLVCLEGREDNLKAYHIATRVYGRPETFDPIKDPIVRIEMAKLRRDLEVYYLKSGAGNPLRISIPRGRYLPQVSRAPRSRSQVADPFLLSVLRAALCAWSGDREGAAAAWQDLKLADPTWPANLQNGVARALVDEKASRLLVEGVRRAGRWADAPEAHPATPGML